MTLARVACWAGRDERASTHREDRDALGQPLQEQIWRSSFPGLGPVLTQLPSYPRTDNYEEVRLGAWSSGRVALVGDAAHALRPTIGQGAGTVMTNALALAIALDVARDPEAALAAWVAAERPPTEEVQRISLRRAMGLIHRSDEPLTSAPDNDTSGPAHRQLKV